MKAAEAPPPDPEQIKNPKTRKTPDAVQAGLEPDAQLRLVLQRRARTNLRSHFQRGALRVGVLLAADGFVFWLMRSVIRAVRDHGLLGAALSATLNDVVPKGYLSGWQYAAGLIISLAITGNYRAGDGRRDPGRLLAAVALATSLPMWSAIWTRGFDLLAVQYAVTVLLMFIAIMLERMTVDRVVGFVRPPELNAAPTLFVGSSRACKRTMMTNMFDIEHEHAPLGYVATDRVAPADALGRLADFSRVLGECQAEVVVMCGDLSQELFGEIVDASFAAGCQVLAVPRVLSKFGVNPSVVWREGQPLLQLTQPALRARQLLLKRMLDVLGSSLGLLVIAPLLLVIGVAIKLDSRGPVLFRQRRVGYGGKTFGMLKFRTMEDGADGKKAELAHLNHTGDRRLFKIPNDPRVTRVGAWLRRWSLDEVPQLWNVLVGDMSLVGPRPFFPGDLERYELHHFDRLGAKPGMTGLWQVSGRSSVLDFEEVVRLDRKYIVTWSLGLDLWIMLRTLPAVLSRHGAF